MDNTRRSCHAPLATPIQNCGKCFAEMFFTAWNDVELHGPEERVQSVLRECPPEMFGALEIAHASSEEWEA